MVVKFDRFTFDSERRALLERTTPVHLGPKIFRLLEILIENRPRAVAKKEIYERIWPDTFVEESSLAGLVHELRTALGDQPRKPRFVRTVHGFGYAFSCATNNEPVRSRAAAVLFRGRELTLHDGVNILGRDPSADVQIDDPTVSRHHASILIRDGAVILEDLSSKNGTFLDEVQLTGSAPLSDRQTIVLGDASMIFRRSPGAGSTLTSIRQPQSRR